ncbi:MAG TPA: response regulator [Chitinophagaceae bacterium]|jgi:CheY-like chemotaxis protein|nr:response regulator [Chitinophagaceae bacterium]
MGPGFNRGERKVILIADDDEDDRMLISDVFRDFAGQVELVLVDNGRKALEFLVSSSSKPCLAVLDLNMPLLSGLEVIKNVGNNEDLRHIPIVVLSTSNSPHHMQECLEQGAIAYRVKPLTYEGYTGIVREMLQLCNLAEPIR